MIENRKHLIKTKPFLRVSRRQANLERGEKKKEWTTEVGDIASKMNDEHKESNPSAEGWTNRIIIKDDVDW